MTGLPIKPVKADDQILGVIFALVHLVHGHDLCPPLVFPLMVKACDHDWITRSRESVLFVHRSEQSVTLGTSVDIDVVRGEPLNLQGSLPSSPVERCVW